MKQFPEKLSVSNMDKFSSFQKDRAACYLRREIYEHMISNGENVDFDLEVFKKTYMSCDKEGFQDITSTIIGELESLGWTCKTAYGGTSLFVFSNPDSPPERYYPDGL